MAAPVVERIKVIDADSHISEPENLWTNRVSTEKWGDLVPHVEYDEKIKEDRWFMGGKGFMPTAGAAMAGWKEPPPDHPPSLQEADHGSWNARERLTRMDEYGIWAQVIYPNIGGFGSGNFLALGEPELMIDCVRAYNDFLLEWCAIDMKRFIPIMAMPFWDVDLCVKEIERCAKAGHKGILMTNQPHVFDQPRITETHWDPLWNTAQDLGLSINFHIGSGDLTKLRGVTVDNGRQAAYAKATVQLFLDNSQAVMDIILSGMCHRFPRLNFVSVESGVGWVPFVLEAMDWQWLNSGCPKEHPEMDLLPSEYFKRQCYACFWFEEQSALKAIEQLGPDNLLYETDFPHPTSMSPGPNSIAQYPKDFIEKNLGHLPEESLRKLLQTNSAKIYHLEV
ncbi:MAG: amidohydrolase family protein [Tepidiformaceae bacterium]